MTERLSMVPRMSALFSIVAAAAMCTSHAAASEEITLYATQDAFAWQKDMWTAHCNETSVFFGESDGESWVYWRWNILGNVPSGSIIQDAWIEVRQLGTSNTGNDIEARFYTIGNDWDECFPGWTVKPNTGDYLFNRTMQGLTGGNAWRTISDSSLISFVQDVVDGVEEDNGIVMRPWNPVDGRYQYYETKEGGFEAELHIEYEESTADPPDIHITRIWTNPEIPKRGATVELGVEFCNEGGSDANNLEIIYYVDGVPVDTDDDDQVAADSCGDPEQESGFFIPDFCHDFEYMVEILPVEGEIDFGDNTMTIQVEMDCPQPEPDVEVRQIWTEPSPPMEGEEVLLKVEICNVGDGVAEDVQLHYRIDGIEIGTDFHDALEPDQCQIEMFPYTFEDCEFDYEFCVEVDPVQGENQTGNNILCDQVEVDCEDQCITLEVQNLVAGQTALWLLDNGDPGAGYAVVWGTGGPPQRVEAFGYCATFGFSGVNQSRVVGTGTFAPDGKGSVGKRIPSGLVGFAVKFQAAQQGTCPEECVSNLIETTVQ